MADGAEKGNRGIVANTITSTGPIAVGDHPQATQTVWNPDRERLLEELSEFKRLVQAASLPTEASTKIMEFVSGLESESRQPQPDTDRLKDHLSSLANIVKSTSEIFGNTTGLIISLGKLAAIVGLGLSAFGL